MKPTDEQIKEFWEWCGLKVIQSADGYLMVKNAKGHTSWLDVDLNNLFKYAVPKVGKNHMGLFAFWIRQAVVEDKDPALALFWALWEVKSNI